MKNLFLLIVLVLFTQVSFGQTKIDEYPRTDSDSEAARIDNFLINLQNKPESKGLIIIYSGESEERLGNILRHIGGIKQYVNFRNINLRNGKTFTEKISFKIDKGKESLFKELWIYPKGVALPKIEPKSLNLDSLKTKYLYASICVSCDPAVPSLSSDFADFELYAELLKKYPDYKSSIIIHPLSYKDWSRKESYRDALTYAVEYRNLLTKKHKIDNRRISIKIAKPFGKDKPVIGKFFITPKIAK